MSQSDSGWPKMKQSTAVAWLSLLAVIGIAVGGAAVTALVQAAEDRQRLQGHLESARPRLDAVGDMRVRLERMEARQQYLTDGQEEIKADQKEILRRLNSSDERRRR